MKSNRNSKSAFLLLATFLALPGCFLNNKLGPEENPLPTTLNGGYDPSLARGQCALIDQSRPERNVCIDCYNRVLSTRCPGKEEPSQCQDPNVASAFTLLVNQCILQTMTAGSSCAKTCTSGLVLDATTCACILPPGGGSVPPVDSGQVNFGPPIVDLDWPLTFVATNSSLQSCEATITPLRFLIQNRGDTVPRFNQHHVEGYSCTSGSYLQSAATPAWSGNRVEGSFDLKTSGAAELISQALVPPNPLDPGVIGGSPTNLFDAATDSHLHTEPALAAGTYLLNFDLTVANDWKGAGIPATPSGPAPEGPHTFKVTAGAATIFNRSFSSLPSYPQSFPGKAIKQGTDFVDGANSGKDAIYRISVPVVHPGGNLNLTFTASDGVYDSTCPGCKIQRWQLENIALRPMGMQDFQTNQDFWTPAARRETTEGNAELSSFLGAFSDAEAATFEIDGMPSGKYVVSFDLYVIDAWFGEGAGLYSAFPLLARNAGGPISASAVSAGGLHGCAVSGTSALCWGNNQSGQLGIGNTTSTPTPTTVANLLNVTGVSSGSQHTCAISNGDAYCFGLNTFGQLGSGSTSNSAGAVAVNPVAPIGAPTQLSAGDHHTCGMFGGNAYCWGKNTNGQLGIGTFNNSLRPAAVAGAISQVAAGGRHTCARMAAGTVQCWGANEAGQAGSNQYNDMPSPFTVPSTTGAGTLSNILEVSAGGAHSCARSNTGAVYCWGDNSMGQLGNGAQASSATPVQVPGISGATSLSAGDTHTCAVLGGGNEVHCWGSNSSGKLGNGTTTNSSLPTPVTGLALRHPVTGVTTTVTQVSAGGSHTCARFANGRVQCWGSNSSGQLANPSTKNKFQVLYEEPGGSETVIFDHTFSNTDFPQTYRGAPTVLKRDLGFLSSVDSIYRLNIITHHSCAPVSDPAAPPCYFKLKFQGEGLDQTRAWGIDNFGVAPLPECGIQYSFTDTNQLTSNYCLRFNPFTSCGQTYFNPANQLECDCFAKPVTGEITPYFAPLSRGESCP